MDGKPVILVNDVAGPPRQQASKTRGLGNAEPRRHTDDAMAALALRREHARAWPLVPARECAEEIGRARGG